MKLVRRVRHARDVARALGAGAASLGTVGTLACRLPGWSVLALTRATAPDWLFAALDQAAREADAGERPVVVVSVVSQGIRLRRVVLLSFDTFQALAGSSEGDDRAGQK